MKQATLCFILFALSCVASAQSDKWQQGISVLKPGVAVLVPTHGYRFIPFADTDTGKIGFLSSASNLSVAIPPTYEDIFFGHYMLMPVKKNGKWGCMDLGARFIREGYSLKDPIIPCIYDLVEVIDNDRVRVYQNGTSHIVDVSKGVR